MRFHTLLRRNNFLLCAVILLLIVVCGFTCIARADDAPQIAHEFKYKPDVDTSVKEVNLAGDFNDWSTSATPLTKSDDGTYHVTVKLAPGKRLYKFVLDGTKWINDPNADKSLEEDDGQQGKNSAVMISATDKPADAGHTFSYKPADGSTPKTVSVAGEFNNWSTDALPMTRGEDSTFTATFKLAPGIYHYKFVVDGTTWIPDPNADKSLQQDDQHQGTNSGVAIGEPATK